jgi:hypothetical protein
MRLSWIAILLTALLAPGASQAMSKTVICDGCGEAEYGKTAMRATDGNETILVLDGSNAQLRKYRVTESGDREGTRVRRVMNRVEPLDKDWAFFRDWVRIYDALSQYLESCGPGSIGDYGAPDLAFGWACEEHDVCYATGGTAQDRSDCDRQLFNNMVQAGATWDLAFLYYLAVRAAGWAYFNWSLPWLVDNWNSASGCAYLEVCDFTEMAPMPR